MPIGSKEWVKTVKNYHALKFDYATTLRSSISTKIRLYGYGAKSRWGLPRVHLGANGIIGSKKWVKTLKYYHALKFDYATTISTKIRLDGYGSNSRCRPPRVHFVDNGVPLGQKKGQNRKKILKFSTTPRLSISAKIRVYGYVAKSWWGITRVHLGANGVPLGPMNGSPR